MQNQTYTSNYKLLPSELLENSVVGYLGLNDAILSLSLVSREHRTIVENSKLHINNDLCISISHDEGSQSKPVLFCYNGDKPESFDDILKNVTIDINFQKLLEKVSHKVGSDYKNNYPYMLNILLNDIITLDFITKLKKGIKSIDINSEVARRHGRILYDLYRIIRKSYACYDIDAAIQKAKDADHVATQVLLELHKEYSKNPVPSFPFW